MIKFQITGHTEIAKALQGLSASVSKEIAMQAMEEAVQPMVESARSLTPVGDTGGLRRSIGFAVRQYRRGKVTFGIVGARRGFGTVDANGRHTEPANYAHLVEYGHAISGATGAGWVNAIPFMRPAWESTKAAVYAILGESLGSGIEVQAALMAQKFQKQAARNAKRQATARSRAVTLGAPV